MPKLGRLAFRKVAEAAEIPQQPAGLFDRMLQQHGAEQGQGRYTGSGSVGPSQQQGQGFVTGQQALLEGAQSAAGPLGVSLAMLGMPWIQQATAGTGIDLAKPWQMGYGGSPRAFQEQGRVAAQMMSAQLTSMGDSGRQLAVAAIEQLGKTGIPVEGVINYLKTADPNTVGTIVQQLSLQFPQVQAIMSRLDPAFISDFTPIAQATYFQNNGDFDEALFQKTMQRFQSDYRSGKYGQVPAQIAAHSVAFVAEKGLPPGAIPDASKNVAQAANSLVDRGLAPSFGAAMELAQSISPEVMQNPKSVQQFANYTDNLARRGFLSRDQIYSAAQYAMHNGLDVASTMTAVGHSGRLKRLMGQHAGKLPDLAATSLAGFQKSEQASVLGAARQISKSLRHTIDTAISKGDVAALTRVYKQVASNPDILNIARQNPNVGVSLAKQMSAKNPAMLGQLMTAQFAEQGKNDPSMRKLLRNPTEIRRRIIQQDLSGLSPAARDFMLRNGGADAAAVLASKSPDYEGAPLPPGVDEVKASRIGLQYPDAQSDRPAPLVRGEAEVPENLAEPVRTGSRPAALPRGNFVPDGVEQPPGLGELAFGDRSVVDPNRGVRAPPTKQPWKPTKPALTRGI
jgi:hypothetical protein